MSGNFVVPEVLDVVAVRRDLFDLDAREERIVIGCDSMSAEEVAHGSVVA